MTEPLARLDALLAQATTPPRFAANSRYHTTPIARLTLPGGRVVAHLTRRLVPPPDAFSTLREHVVAQGDRLDAIAAAQLGDPELFWRLCDANAALAPDELTAVVARRVRIPLPEGVPGSAGAR